jgi:two-component system, NarL family, response regulator LiaR
MALYKHKIILVEDHVILLEALVVALNMEDDLDVVGFFSSAEEALAFAESNSFDIAIVDKVLSGMDGISFTRRIKEMCKNAKIIIISMFTKGEFIHEAFEAGAVAYLPKEIRLKDFIAAVRSVSQGETVISPKIAGKFLRYVSSLSEGPQKKPFLSPEQILLLQFACQGLSNKEIAAHLGTQETSVKVKFQRLYKALGAKDRAHAVYKGMSLELVPMKA